MWYTALSTTAFQLRLMESLIAHFESNRPSNEDELATVILRSVVDAAIQCLGRNVQRLRDCRVCSTIGINRIKWILFLLCLFFMESILFLSFTC